MGNIKVHKSLCVQATHNVKLAFKLEKGNRLGDNQVKYYNYCWKKDYYINFCSKITTI